jgi:hypothetical protein
MADVLDLTNSHLRNLTSIEISPTLTVRRSSGQAVLQHCVCCVTAADRCPAALDVQALDLTANRLQTLDPRVLALTGVPCCSRWSPLHLALMHSAEQHVQCCWLCCPGRTSCVQAAGRMKTHGSAALCYGGCSYARVTAAAAVHCSWQPATLLCLA